jgi:hypothetical protein
VVIAPESGRFSTPQGVGSVIAISGILDRPVKPRDDSVVQTRTALTMSGPSAHSMMQIAM